MFLFFYSDAVENPQSTVVVQNDDVGTLIESKTVDSKRDSAVYGESSSDEGGITVLVK